MSDPVIVPRSVWEDPAYRISGPPAQLGLISAITAHYPGGNPGDLSSDAACAAYMRRMQREYVTDRGYSLGYSWMIPPNGTIWEARGLLYVNAANGSATWNARSFAVQFANGPGEALTEAQKRSARLLHGHLMALCDRQLAWNAHGQVRSQTWPTLAPPSQWTTACPGQLIWRALASGELDFRPLPPPVIPEEDEMFRFVQVPGDVTVYKVSGVHALWVNPGTAVSLELPAAAGGAVQMIDRVVLKGYQLIGAAPWDSGIPGVTTSAADFNSWKP